MTRLKTTAAATVALLALIEGVAKADQVIPDDLIVQGSGCFGFDCVNNENFGANTIILKENNLRIRFQDTSVGAFPANSWQLTANDDASGGANYFGIDDVTANRRLMTLSAGARANSIFLSSASKVGFGTSAPVLDLHMLSNNTPALRMEQDNTGGFTAQTWDIGANEANFFVRDVTGGSKLPLRIRPGAPTSSLDIAASGRVGLGTASPLSNLHVSSSGDAAFRLQTTGGVTGSWTLSTATASGDLVLSDAISATSPIIVKKAATGAALVVGSGGKIGLNVVDPTHRLHVNGPIRFESLLNCTNGIRTNANGVLSCMPAPAAGQQVSAAGQVLSNGASSGLKAAGVATASLGAPGKSSDGASTDEVPPAAACTAAELAGTWSLAATNIEVVGPGSALWCDVGFSAVGPAGLGVAGTCRNHGAANQEPAVYQVAGEAAITDAASCKINGSLRFKSESGITFTATLLEGRVESSEGKRTRALAVSRWSRSGRASVAQTLTLQR